MKKRVVILFVASMLMLNSCNRESNVAENPSNSQQETPQFPQKPSQKVEEKMEKMELIPYNETDLSKLKNDIKRLIEEYKKTETELKKFEALPQNNPNYSNLLGIKSEIDKLSKGYLDNAENIDSKTEKKEILDIYVNTAVWLLGYKKIELMASKAEEYSKEFPNNEEIKVLIEKCFKDLSQSLDGDPFIQSFNRDTVDNFNKIVDIVNQQRKNKN